MMSSNDAKESQQNETTARISEDEVIQRKKHRRARFEFARLIILVFIFVYVRGPLFQVEDLTKLGWHRVYVWRAVNSLVKAGILEKFDRKSYGVTDEGRDWFREAFGGGANDANFAYSAMAVETWGEARLNFFKENLSEMWRGRSETIKSDPARIGSTTLNQEEDCLSLVKVLCEKMEETSYIASLLARLLPTRKLP